MQTSKEIVFICEENQERGLQTKFLSLFIQCFHFSFQRRGSKIPDDDEIETKYFVIKPTNQVVPEGSSDTEYQLWVSIWFKPLADFFSWEREQGLLPKTRAHHFCLSEASKLETFSHLPGMNTF